LFADADNALQQVKKVSAFLLSPDNFEMAMEYYREAENDLVAGDNLEDIREKLKSAVEYFNKALEVTELAEVTFTKVIAARSDALEARAHEFSTELWNDAEEMFNLAAKELEGGDVNDAKERGGEAETFYRRAELDAIETHLLADTRILLNEAEKQYVEDSAPLTLQKAKLLVEQTEAELNKDRYDTDDARRFVQQAKYEVLHSLYLSKLIKELADQDKTFENVILMSEEPLHKIAAQLDIKAEFDEGYDKPSKNIISSIEVLQDSVSKNSQELAVLKQELELLKRQLSGIESEKTALSEQMEALEKVKQQYTEVQKIFNRSEAIVFRQENDILIRLVGLNFDVGKSLIKPDYYGLLSNVEKAIKIFPRCTITAEGHTDSQGSDETNLQLSQERADAVKSYLLANMELEWSRIRSIGFGESKPIANNETIEGRKKNRRIDLIIHPTGL
jgi:outer membrane protein OmpA-like peptidoglycan-associated protein